MRHNLQQTSSLERSVDDLESKGLDTRWFREDKTPEDKEKTAKVLRNSTIQFRLLKEILRDEFRSHNLKPIDFDKPNFDQRRLYSEGYLRALQNIFKILP